MLTIWTAMISCRSFSHSAAQTSPQTHHTDRPRGWPRLRYFPSSEQAMLLVESGSWKTRPSSPDLSWPQLTSHLHLYDLCLTETLPLLWRTAPELWLRFYNDLPSLSPRHLLVQKGTAVRSFLLRGTHTHVRVQWLFYVYTSLTFKVIPFNSAVTLEFTFSIYWVQKWRIFFFILLSFHL